MAHMDTTDVDRAARGFYRASRDVPVVARRIVLDATTNMRNLVKMYTLGIGGGPQYRTGEYHNSIGMTVKGTHDGAIGEVGTDEPRGYRLELGGSNELRGRIVTTAPHPHFGPAAEITEELMHADAGARIDAVVHEAINS